MKPVERTPTADHTDVTRILGQTFRTITVPGHLPWNPETSEQLHAAALQQLNARNLFTEELLKHPNTPIQKNTAENETGLYGLWLEWREALPYLAETKQAIWRPAATLAKTTAGTGLPIWRWRSSRRATPARRWRRRWTPGSRPGLAWYGWRTRRTHR